MPPVLPREIRQLVQQQFLEICPNSRGIESEALLIREGEYCGHRYQSAGVTAVWFFEENQIKVHDAEGHVIRVVCPSDSRFVKRADAA